MQCRYVRQARSQYGALVHSIGWSPCTFLRFVLHFGSNCPREGVQGALGGGSLPNQSFFVQEFDTRKDNVLFVMYKRDNRMNNIQKQQQRIERVSVISSQELFVQFH